MSADSRRSDHGSLTERAHVHGESSTVYGNAPPGDQRKRASPQRDGGLVAQELSRPKPWCVLAGADAALGRLTPIRIHVVEIHLIGLRSDAAERNQEIGAMQATAADTGIARLPHTEAIAERDRKRLWSAHPSTVHQSSGARRSCPHVESSGQVAVRLLLGIRSSSKSQFVPLRRRNTGTKRDLGEGGGRIPGRNATWARAADGCRDETRPGRGRKPRTPGKHRRRRGRDRSGRRRRAATRMRDGPSSGNGYSARRRRAAMPPSTSMNVPVVEPEAGETR